MAHWQPNMNSNPYTYYQYPAQASHATYYPTQTNTVVSSSSAPLHPTFGVYPAPAGYSVTGQGYPSAMYGPNSAPMQPPAQAASSKAATQYSRLNSLPTEWRWVDGGDMHANSQSYVRHLSQQLKSGQLRYEDVLVEALRIRPGIQIGLPASTATKYLTSAEISCTEKISLVRPWAEQDFEHALAPFRDSLRNTTPDTLSDVRRVLYSLHDELDYATDLSNVPGVFVEGYEDGDSDALARAELKFVASIVKAFLRDTDRSINVGIFSKSSNTQDEAILGRRVIPDMRVMAARGDRNFYNVATVERKTLAAGSQRLNYFMAVDEPFIWPSSKDMYKSEDEAEKRIIVQVYTQMSYFGVNGAILHTLGYQMYFWREYRGTWILYRTNWRKNSYADQAAFLLFCVRDLGRRRWTPHQAAAAPVHPGHQNYYSGTSSTSRSEMPNLAVTGALDGSSLWHLGRSKSFAFVKKFLFPFWSNLDIRIGRLQQACITRFDSSFMYSWLRWLPALPVQCRVLTNNIREERSVLLCPELNVIFKVFPTRKELLEESALIAFASSKGIAVPKVTGLYTGMFYVLAEEWAGETISDWENMSSASIVCLISELEKCQVNHIHHHDLAPRNIVARHDDTVCILDWGCASLRDYHDHCPDVEIMEGLKELLESRNSSNGLDQQGRPNGDLDPGDHGKDIEAENSEQHGYSATDDGVDSTDAIGEDA